MKPLRFDKAPPAVTNPNAWVRTGDGSFRSGNVLIRCDERTPFGGYTFERWHIYRMDGKGRLVRVHPKSRPWGYGRAGAAKIGASHLAEPQEG